jgi:hypothetical protein
VIEKPLSGCAAVAGILPRSQVIAVGKHIMLTPLYHFVTDDLEEYNTRRGSKQVEKRHTKYYTRKYAISKLSISYNFP